jgi:hypothetical protein
MKTGCARLVVESSFESIKQIDYPVGMGSAMGVNKDPARLGKAKKVVI